MTQLAQTYIHLRPYDISPNELTRLGLATDRLAHDAALRVYGGNVHVDVKLEEGSLKGTVTVLGVLLGAYGFVSDYKDFKEGIAEMCKDARAYGVEVCDAFTKAAGASSTQVFRAEKRLQTPGKLDRVLRELERLDGEANTPNPDELRLQLAKIRNQLDIIERDLTPRERGVIEEVLRFERLPPISDWPDKIPTEIDLPRVAIRRETERELSSMADIFFHDAWKSIQKPKQKAIYHNTFAVRPSGQIERNASAFRTSKQSQRIRNHDVD